VKPSDRFLNRSVAAPPTEDPEETGGHVSADKPNPDGTNARRGLPVAPSREASTAAPGDDELVRRARNDDPRAIAQLVDRYQKKVYGIAYQFCGFDKSEAQDMAQEALLQIFRNLKRFEGRSQFSTWLYRVAGGAGRISFSPGGPTGRTAATPAR
jgi:hypothetical protein